MEYHAFVSYSHAADARLARALQSGLQNLAKPWFRRPIIKIFRDQTSLSANPGLWSELERNLSRCSHFILLASRAAAQSVWVQREVAWWITNRSVDTLFIVVTDGNVRWQPDATDFDWPSTTALPGALKGQFTEEPLYVDLTWAKGKDDLSLRHSQFRAAVLDLAAPLHGKPKDELDSEDIRQNRRLRAAAWTAVSAISILAIGVSIAAWIAVQNQREAVRQSITAISRQHAVEAQLGVRDGQLETAVTSALKAIRTEDSAEARAALFATLEAAWDTYAVLRLHQAPVLAIAFRHEDKELLTWSADNVLVRWDVAGRRPVRAPDRGTRLDARSAAFSPDTRVLATGLADGTTVLWDVDTMKVRARLRDQELPEVTALAFDNSGTRLAVGYGFLGRILLWDVSRGTRAPITLEQSDQLGHEASVSGLWFSDDDRYLAAANQNPSASVGVWELPSGKLVGRPNPSTSFWVNTTVAFVSGVGNMRGDTYLFVGASDGSVQTFRDTPRGEVRFQHLRSATQHQGAVSAIAIRAGAMATGGADGRVTLFAEVDGRPVVPASWTNARVSTLTFGSTFLAAGTADGTVTLYYGRPSRPRTVDDVVFTSSVARRSPDGNWIVRSASSSPGAFEQRFSITHAATGRGIPGIVQGSVSFSADSRWLLAQSEGWFALWNLSDQGSLSAPIIKRAATLTSFSQSGRYLVTERLTEKSEVRLIDLTARPFREHVLSKDVFGRFRAFSADETLALATTGRDLHLWDVTRGAEIGPPIVLEPLSDDDDDDDDDTYRIAFSPDAQWIVAGRSLGTSSLYRTRAAKDQPAFPVKRFTSARFSPDGQWVAVAAPGQVDGVWNLKTLTVLFQSDGKSPGNWDFTKDGRRLFGTTPDHHLEIWDLQQATPGRKTFTTSVAYQVELSPDGRWLLSADRGEKTTLTELSTLTQRPLSGSLVRPHAFSPDGSLLAADDGGPLVLIDVASGVTTARLEGHSKRLHGVAFSPDGRVLASIDANGSLILWDPTTARRLSETFAGTGEDEDSINRLRFEPDGLALQVGGRLDVSSALPAHPWAWIADICARIDPGVSQQEWTKFAGAVAYPWTCESIKGITRDDLR